MAASTRKTIFVGNITQHTTSEHLAQAFAPFGTVTEIVIPVDPSNQSSRRNFAFVTFTQATSALDAIDNMNYNVLPTFPNKVLRVNLARGNNKASNQKTGEPNSGLGSRKAIWEDEAWLKANEEAQDEAAEQKAEE